MLHNILARLWIYPHVFQLRTEKGMTQQEFAAELDYEKSNMSRLESGRVNPRISTLYKVAKVLNVTLSDLLMIE